MRKALSAVIFVAALLGAIPVFAQSPNFNVGPVWRVTYFHIKPGQGDAFWNDFRQHGKPVFDEDKKQGLITDYKLFTNPALNSPGDWDVAIGILYPNWAALDQLAAKGATIAIQHYGSREKMLEAGRKRDDIREVVASHLAREVIPK
jgi:ABC-type sugar transport system substrate-binding protein